MAQDRDDIIALADENGNEEEFEYIDSIEYNGVEYVMLSPVARQTEDSEEEEVVILKVVEGPDGEEEYLVVGDEDELDGVFEEFMERLSDEYEYDFDEDEGYEFDEEE